MQVSDALAGTGSFIFVLDSEMYAVMSTRRDYAPGRQGLSADPDTSSRALSSDTPIVSNMVKGTVSQEYVVNVLLGVRGTTKGDVILGFNRSASQLAPVLLSNRLPDGWNVALVDGHGQVIAASPGAGATGEARTSLDDLGGGAAPGHALHEVARRAAQLTATALDLRRDVLDDGEGSHRGCDHGDHQPHG